jgi:hypothetical protein
MNLLETVTRSILTRRLDLLSCHLRCFRQGLLLFRQLLRYGLHDCLARAQEEPHEGACDQDGSPPRTGRRGSRRARHPRRSRRRCSSRREDR